MTESLQSMFWAGFEKRADEHPTVINDWVSDVKAATTKAKAESKIDTRIDPAEAGQWLGPEAWYRHGWP